MSVQAIGWVLDHSPARGTDRLVMISLANYAGKSLVDGAWESWPGIATLQREANLERERSVQDSLSRMVKEGYLERVINGAPDERIRKDRRPNLYRVLISHGVTCNSTPCDYCQPNTGCRETSPRESERGDVSTGNGVPFTGKTGCRETSPEPLEEKPLLEPKEKKEGVPPSRKSSKALDPRQDHPAIAALRDLTKLFPPKELWDTIIAELGETPDLNRLRSCFIEWRTRDFRPTNYAWARDWYIHGIPNHPGYLGRPYRPITKVVPIDTDEFHTPTPLRERRPPDDSPPEHRELWRSVLDALRPRMSTQVFGCWFGNLIFDGLNDEKNAFKVRADQYTHDWITRYYSEAIYETLTTLNLGEFTFQWEIEDEFEEALAA